MDPPTLQQSILDNAVGDALYSFQGRFSVHELVASCSPVACGPCFVSRNYGGVLILFCHQMRVISPLSHVIFLS